MSDRPTTFEVVTDYFAHSGRATTRFGEKPILRFTHVGANGEWVCVAHVRESESQFVFYSMGLAAVPAHARLEMALFLTYANVGLIIGNFEMDIDDGEVRFRTSVDIKDDRLSSRLLRQLVETNIEMMDTFLPGMRAVIAGVDPRAAIAAIEGAVETHFES